MSDNYVDTYALFTEFDSLNHFADKAVIAEQISRSMYQPTSQVMYDPESTLPRIDTELRKMLLECSHVLAEEFNIFAIRTMDGKYHVFFTDEDRLPIDATFDVAEDDVFDTFKIMCVKKVLGSVLDRSDNGILCYREHHCLTENDHVGDAELLSAYDFLQENKDIYWPRDLKVMLHNYLKLPSNCWLTKP